MSDDVTLSDATSRRDFRTVAAAEPVHGIFGMVTAPALNPRGTA